VAIETLRDNLASKMTALVERGAPRDFLDIYNMCKSGVVTPAECWKYYRQKHSAKNLGEEQEKVLVLLKALELRRPIESIKDSGEQKQAEEIRTWFKNVCNTHEISRKMGL
jgi:predicted nucleotidyltransferase component of viral defense system